MAVEVLGFQLLESCNSHKCLTRKRVSSFPTFTGKKVKRRTWIQKNHYWNSPPSFFLSLTGVLTQLYTSGNFWSRGGRSLFALIEQLKSLPLSPPPPKFLSTFPFQKMKWTSYRKESNVRSVKCDCRSYFQSLQHLLSSILKRPWNANDLQTARDTVLNRRKKISLRDFFFFCLFHLQKNHTKL